uniref:hypothetical protein n=1 Tax=Carnobacterium sp. TaxID=48221 RepID=UPI00344D4AEA
MSENQEQDLSYKVIREQLKTMTEKNYKDYIKAIISVEKEIEDEKIMDKIYDGYINNDNLTGFLAEEFDDIIDIAKEEYSEIEEIVEEEIEENNEVVREVTSSNPEYTRQIKMNQMNQLGR